MLLHRSKLYQFTGLLFAVSISAQALGISENEESRPNYDEFYNTRAASAIKDIGSEAGDLVSIASAKILQYAEADQIKEEAKEKPQYQTYEIPKDTLARFSLEEAYEDEIDALDREYSSPTVYKLDSVQVSDTQKQDSSEYNSSPSSSSSYIPKGAPVKSSYYSNKSKKSKPKKASIPESKEQDSYIPQYHVKHTETPKENPPYDKYKVELSVNKNIQSKSYSPIPTKTGSSDDQSSFKKDTQSRPYTSPSETFSSYNRPTFNKNGQTKSYTPSKIFNSDKYQIQASENVGKASDCEEVKKPSDGKGPDMKCVICKDSKTGFKSEQCSYSSASEPEAYVLKKSTKYSQPHDAVNQRYKRYTSRANAPDKDRFDPYEQFKAESQKLFAVDEGDFFKDYKFPSDYLSGDTLDKSESEVQAEKIMKDGATCKEVKKDDMTCRVCKNEKNGGNFESCSYSSAPNEKKYAFVSEKKSNGNDEPEEKSTDRSKLVEKKIDPKVSETVHEEIKRNRGRVKTKLVDDQPYDIPKHFAEDTKHHGSKSKYYQTKDDDDEEKDSQPTDEYYQKLFKTKPTSSQESKSYTADNDKKDVEKVLEEFAKKDRSTCKKANKSGMTCYLCVNKDGTQHEECMYVAGNQPQKSHIAYHEIEELKSKENPTGAASTVREVTVHKRKHPIKKAYSNALASPSVKVTTTAKLTPSSIVNGKFRQPRKLRRTQNYSGADPVVEETKSRLITAKIKSLPQKTSDAKAASSNIKYVYSKELGIRLPKQFLEKSDFEKSFDARP